MQSKIKSVSVLFAIFSIPLAAIAAFFSSDPTVPEISAAELHELITAQNGVNKLAKTAGPATSKPEFVVVDVRSEAEVAVSVIPGAITKDQYEANRNSYAARTVIAYCTIGYRSGIYARALAARGVTAINFKGSILDWCDKQNSLVTMEGEPTNQVHVYSSQYQVPANYTAVF